MAEQLSSGWANRPKKPVDPRILQERRKKWASLPELLSKGEASDTQGEQQAEDFLQTLLTPSDSKDHEYENHRNNRTKNTGSRNAQQTGK